MTREGERQRQRERERDREMNRGRQTDRQRGHEQTTGCVCDVFSEWVEVERFRGSEERIQSSTELIKGERVYEGECAVCAVAGEQPSVRAELPSTADVRSLGGSHFLPPAGCPSV